MTGSLRDGEVRFLRVAGNLMSAMDDGQSGELDNLVEKIP
jgi:hypothetical protein